MLMIVDMDYNAPLVRYRQTCSQLFGVGHWHLPLFGGGGGGHGTGGDDVGHCDNSWC